MLRQFQNSIFIKALTGGGLALVLCSGSILNVDARPTKVRTVKAQQTKILPQEFSKTAVKSRLLGNEGQPPVISNITPALNTKCGSPGERCIDVKWNVSVPTLTSVSGFTVTAEEQEPCGITCLSRSVTVPGNLPVARIKIGRAILGPNPRFKVTVKALYSGFVSTEKIQQF